MLLRCSRGHRGDFQENGITHILRHISLTNRITAITTPKQADLKFQLLQIYDHFILNLTRSNHPLRVSTSDKIPFPTHWFYPIMFFEKCSIYDIFLCHMYRNFSDE